MNVPILSLFLVILAGTFTSCDRQAEATAPPGPSVPKVHTGEVVMRDFADEIEALGTVRAMEAIDISANVTETVTAVSFEDGQTVAKGDLLAQLSDDEEQAMLAGAEINLAEQKREVERLGRLADNGAVSKVRLQEYLTARDLALQKIEEARAKIADRQVLAPFDGVLGFRQISVGTLVSPGKVLATLDFIDTIKLDFSVPETFLGGLVPGREIIAHSGAFPDDEFAGEVKTVNARVNPVTRSAMVRAEIANADHKLRPGMLLTTLVTKNPANSPSVPERAIVALQSRHSVFVVEGTAGETTAKSVEVQIGRRIPGYVEILGGLAGGETIVVDGLVGLRDGGAILVTGEARPPSAPYSPVADPQPGESPN